MNDCWTPAEAHRGALAHQRISKPASSLYSPWWKQDFGKSLARVLLQRRWFPQLQAERLAGSQPSLEPTTRLQIPTCNAPQGRCARMKAQVQGHVSVCVRRPVISLTPFSAASTLVAILCGRLWNLWVPSSLWLSVSGINQSEARSRRKTPPSRAWRRVLPRSSCGERGRSCGKPIRKEVLRTLTNGSTGGLRPMRVGGPLDTWVGKLSAET